VKRKLDRDTTEALLGGSLVEGFEALAATLAAASRLPEPDRTDAETMGSRMAAAVAAPARRVHRVRQPLGRRIAVVAIAAVVALSGSLAAAGALPAGAQDVAHSVLDKVGIHVPNSHAGTHPYERGKSPNTKPKHFGPAPSTPSAQPEHGRPASPGKSNK